jgi:hypothetical protein
VPEKGLGGSISVIEATPEALMMKASCFIPFLSFVKIEDVKMTAGISDE